MQYVRLATFTIAVLWTVSGAWAQYGAGRFPAGPNLNLPAQPYVAPPIPAVPPIAPGYGYGVGGASSVPYSYQPYGCGAGVCESYPSLECQPCAVCPWYITASGLILTRNDADKVWTTNLTGDESEQLLSTADAETGWRGGVEFRLGRRFACGTWTVEGVFWTLDNTEGEASWARRDGGGELSTPLNFEEVKYPSDPTGAFDRPENLFDYADVHRIRRVNELYNTEINLLRSGAQTCGPLDVDYLLGVRWFHWASAGFISANISPLRPWIRAAATGRTWPRWAWWTTGSKTT